mgnify:CR=1 FL=1
MAMVKLRKPLLKMDPDKKKNQPPSLREYLEAIELNGGPLEPHNFTASFSVDESGIVDVGIDWPENTNEKSTSMMATLLFSLNSGLLKNLMLEAISDSAQKYPELKPCIEKVVQNWLELQNSSDAGPCIKPTDTLKNV